MRLGLWGYGHLGKAIAEGLDVMERADVRRLLRERGGAAHERAKGKRTQPY